MSRKSWMAALAIIALSGCESRTPEQATIDDAATALGGRQAILAVKTLTLEGGGTHGDLGQDMRPEATSQTFIVTALRRSIDLGAAAGRMRTEQTRTPNFPYYQGQAPQTQVQGLDGDVAYSVAPDGSARRVPDAAAKDWRAELYHHPLTIVRLALDPSANVTNARTEGGQRLVDVTGTDGTILTLAIDETNLPARVSSRTADPNLGDVTITTTFADYQPEGGLTLPTRLTTTTDDFQTAEIRVAKQIVNGDAGSLVAPASVSRAPLPAPPAPTVTAEEVARGVWWLAGQSHHSALVEFADHLMLIEAPQSEARTLAVIAKARELRPDKPLTQVVNSHHHFDHSAGIRAAVSEGLEVITHSGNRAFFEDAVARAHTIAPDALARNPQPLEIDIVDEEKVIEDPTMTVVLYPVTGNPHSDTMLMAYLPRERILIEVDAFTPGAQVQPYAQNLLENVQTRKLRVDRIVPLHGAIAPFSDLVKTVAPTAP